MVMSQTYGIYGQTMANENNLVNLLPKNDNAEKTMLLCKIIRSPPLERSDNLINLCLTFSIVVFFKDTAP